jgi:hypothetical protein
MVALPREGNIVIMEAVKEFPFMDNERGLFNQCWLYLWALFLSNILDASGRYLLEEAWSGNDALSRHKQESWPNQGKPARVPGC